jgi:hypothetical protein
LYQHLNAQQVVLTNPNIIEEMENNLSKDQNFTELKEEGQYKEFYNELQKNRIEYQQLLQQ